MQSFFLTEIQTQDKLIHQGIYFEPEKKGKKAILWIHGLTSTFYGNSKLLNIFVQHCASEQMGFASFNNRGHDMVTSIKKIDPQKDSGYDRIPGGAGYESFTDSVFDIDAGVSFLVSKGFSEIVVTGHSTGANKVCYYAATNKNQHARGFVLASPVSDRYDPAFNQEKVTRDLKKMNKLIAQGKGDQLQLGYHFFPITPNRYVSLLTPHSTEDQFDYGEEKPRLKYFSQITKPLLVLLGSLDEYLDRPAEDALKIYKQFATAEKYESVLLENINHGYYGAEEEVAKTIVNWVALL